MGNYLSRLAVEARMEQDDSASHLITMEDAQYATLSPSGSPSTESTLDRPIDTHAVEKTILFEISADKERIAYVIEKSEPNQGRQFYLRLMKITYPNTGPVLSQGFEDKKITDCMQGVNKFIYSFLSLSSNGDRVAISFWSFGFDEKLTSERPKCCVFRVSESGINMEKQIECQGKAVFTPDDHLAIVSKNVLNLYNCKEDYKLASSLNIRHMFPIDERAQTYIRPEAYQVFWSSSLNGPLELDTPTDKMMPPLQVILHLTRFVECNLLAPCFHQLASEADVRSYEGICVWSLIDGVKSIPFKTEDKVEVLAISSDKTLVATFGNELTYLCVYHLQSGLLISKLKSEMEIKARQRYHLQYWRPELLYCVHFSKDNEYVILITIRGELVKKANYEALLLIEVWNRNAEKSIYQHEEVIRVDWNSKSNLQPYIIESADSPAAFKAVYTTRSENGECLFKSLKLKLFKEVTTSNWKVEPLPTREIDNFMKRVCVLSLDSEHDDIRYQLCVGKFTIELWCLYRHQDLQKKVLIYIRAFKPPRYHQGKAFKEEWILDAYDESKPTYQSVPVIKSIDQLVSLGIRFMKTQNRLGVSIKYNDGAFQEDRSTSNNALVHQDEIYLPFDALQHFKKQGIPNFFCTDFHYIESTCRGLHFLYLKCRKTKNHILLEETANLLQQTKGLIQRSIKEMALKKSRYFTTISGSNTLAMLASFQDGRDIVFQILQTDDFPISILSYVRTFAKTEKMGEFVERKENALTVLIEKFDYELFDLLFNRVLLNSTNVGVGAFCSITDTIMFLQGRGETIAFQNSCKKLKFLAMKSSIGQLSENRWDARWLMDVDVLHKDTSAEFSDFFSYATKEQILRHNLTWSMRTMRDLQRLVEGVLTAIQRLPLIREYCEKLYLRNYYNSSVHYSLISVCAVPLVHFGSYTIFWEDVEFESHHSNRDDKNWTARLNAVFYKLLYPSSTKDKIAHKVESNLIQLASRQHENDLFRQKGSVAEVLLNYKWKTFIRRRFYWLYAMHLLYYLSFCIGVLFARECLSYTFGASILNSPKHVFLISLVFATNLILSVQELLQFLHIGFWRYIKSVYNIIDLAALVMPPVCFWLMITGSNSLDEVSAITTIILWMHGILRLRPFASIGVTLETMIQLMKSVYKTLIVMLVVIFAFTHAFIVLLLHKDDSYFQEQYSGSINLTDTMSNTENTVSYSDTSASNSFTNLFKAFSTLWLFIYGVWDPITDGDAGDDVMIIVFAMMFSFVTVLLLFNLVIALMSSKAEEVKALGKSIWLSHFAEVIAEIEQFWCTKSERINRKNSPSVVYYITKYTDVRQQAELLEKECDSLIKELAVKLKKRQRANRST